VRLAALFHDLGKPQSRKMGESGVWTFYNHEQISAEMCRKILNRLRYPNAVIDQVCHLVKKHMFLYTEDWSDSAVRRFIAGVGQPNLENIYRLRRADAYGFCGKEKNCPMLASLVKRVDTILTKSQAFSLKDLAINGKDLMSIGITGGKTMGIILKQLLETVLDDPGQNTKEKLLEIAEKINKERV